jgi:PST family polysaccharide transporter
MSNINQRMAKGIFWMVCARLMDRSIGIVSTLILARVLVPADFGLVAMATAIAGILDLLGAFSFDLALIQKAKADNHHYDTVWTFNVLFGIFCAFGLIALAVPAAGFYHEPRLTDVMYVLSISYIISGFANVGVVNFRKEMAFEQEFLFIFLRRVVTFAATMIAAFLFRSYWALVVGTTIGRIVGVILSYWMSAYRPTFTLSAARELFHFSKWLLLNNFLYFLLHDGCTFIIGRVFGVTELGIYTVAYEISNLPTTELVAPINRVTFPGFSKMTTVAEMSVTYLKVMGVITLMIVPVGVGIAAVAEPLVLVALGEKWIGAVTLIQILAVYGGIGATQGNNGTVWMALGRPRDLTVNVAIFLCVLFPCLYFFVHKFGIVGAGFAYLASLLPTVVYGQVRTRRLLHYQWAQLYAVIWRPIVATLLMYFFVRAIDPMLWDLPPIARLLCESALGALLYIATVLLLWTLARRPSGAEMFCLNRIAGYISRSELRA